MKKKPMIEHVVDRTVDKASDIIVDWWAWLGDDSTAKRRLAAGRSAQSEGKCPTREKIERLRLEARVARQRHIMINTVWEAFARLWKALQVARMPPAEQQKFIADNRFFSPYLEDLLHEADVAASRETRSTRASTSNT
jgi:hypothetical protein